MLETHHTTHIEGTQLTLEQSELLLQGQSIEHVRNYSAALGAYRKIQRLFSRSQQNR